MQCLLHLATETDDNSRSSILDGHSGAGFLRHGIIPEFDDYELLEEIAHGGMGVVYRARQVSLNRTVAVKLILAGQLATPDSIERFQLEARAAAHLDHPGIVPVYKVGEYQGQHFISMKLIDGDNLDRQLRRHSLDRSMSPAELRSRQTAIAGLVSRIARAVQYAHDHGVLHRDIKPHNILIDREGNPHLTDFGLAKLTGHDQAGLTLTDAVLGSPSYMAPEQAAGDFAEITVQTDVYGVGALLYELLAGRPPFLGRSVLETMQKLADQPPRSPRSFIPGVHPDLETIALKCLEKRPIHRYLSAGVLADELDRFCNGQPIKARPVSIAVSMSRWCLRHKLVASLSATILIAFLTGFVAVTWQWQRAEKINSRLQASLDRQHWIDIVEMVDRYENSNALAHLARRLRNDPDDWRAAMLATSILDHRRFAVPAFTPVTHGRQVSLSHSVISPDGTVFGTAGHDGTGRIWDASTGKERHRFQHTDVVSWLEFSPDGALVLTGSHDGTATLWRTESGENVVSLSHPGPVNMACFCDDGSVIASACSNGTLQIWNVETGDLLSSVRCGDDIRAIDFGPDNQVAAGCADGSICVMNVSQGISPEETFRQAMSGAIQRVMLSHDGRFLLASSHSRVTCWDIESGQSVFDTAAQPENTPALAWRRNLAAISPSGRAVQVIDLETSHPVGDRVHSKYTTFAMAFDRLDQHYASGGWDYEVGIRDVQSGIPTVNPIQLPAPPHFLQFSPDNSRLLVEFESVQYVTDTPPENVSVSIWNLDGSDGVRRFRPTKGVTVAAAVNYASDRFAIVTGSEVVILDPEFRTIATLPVGAGPRSLAFTPDDQRLVVGMTGGRFSVWDVHTQACMIGPVQTGAESYCYRLDPEGRILGAEADGRVGLWNIETGDRIALLDHGGTLNDITFSPDGRLLSTATDGYTAKIWDLSTFQCLHTLEHNFRVEACKFSPDGSKLVTGSDDFTAKIWDIQTGRQIGSTMEHQGEVSNAEFSPDGKRILTSARNGTACIWDADTGRPLVPMMIHDSALREANISPNGRVAVTIDHDALRVWDMETGLPLGVKILMKSGVGIGHDSMGERAPFLRDSSHILWTMVVPESRLCSTEIPPLPVPGWYPDLLENVGGVYLSSDDMLVRKSVAEQLSERANLAKAAPSGAAYYLHRLRRRLDDHPATSTVPDSLPGTP